MSLLSAIIEYWHKEDNGMWEDYEDIHISSVGVCLAKLIKTRKVVDVPRYLIDKKIH